MASLCAVSAQNDLSLDCSQSQVFYLDGELIIQPVFYDGVPYTAGFKLNKTSGEWALSRFAAVAESDIIACQAVVTTTATGATVTNLQMGEDYYQANLEVIDAQNVKVTIVPQSDLIISVAESAPEADGTSSETESESAEEAKDNNKEESQDAAEQEAKTAELRLELDEVTAQLAQAAVKIDQLTKENNKLTEQLEEVQKTEETGDSSEEVSVPEKEEQVVQESRKSDSDLFDLSGYQTVVHQGFENSISESGEWESVGDEIHQTDGDQFFARLRIPVEQTVTPTLFSFQARASAVGWNGYGLHLFASGSDRQGGYGMGRSLLVWLTRDPDYYGNRNVHLELYRSDNDVAMERVLGGIIGEDLSVWLQVDVLVDPVQNRATLFVDGELKIHYRLPMDLSSGMEVAFRTLGSGCRFRDFKILEP